ncbi:MAG: putative toxin-antitoxin system toxin component, PIN family, partial [Thermoproteota archaeon]
MHTLVFDVNVLISSLITRGKPRRLWLEARKKRFILALSEEIVSEFVKVIARRKFARYVKEEDV